MTGQTELLSRLRSTHSMTEALFAESILRQWSFTLEEKVFCGRINKQTAILCADTTVARAGAGDSRGLHRELGSSTVTGALVDFHFPVSRCHEMWCFVEDDN